MNRRDFLKIGGLGVLSLIGAAAGGNANRAEAKPVKHENTGPSLPTGRKVDIHSHAILPAYIRGMEALDIDPVAEEGYPLPKWSKEAHLQFMADAGIDYSILSLPTPHIYRGNAVQSRKVARAINEEMARLAEEYPDKFGFVATLPFPDVEGSLEEIRYAMEELGALGVKVASNSNGVYLGDPCLEEVFAELNHRKSLVILHPSPARQLPWEDVVTGRVMALFEYPADTTRAVLNLLANGTLDRCPDVRLVVPHCGSFLPYMKSRAKAMFTMLAGLGMMEPVNMEKSMGGLYFDLAGDPMPIGAKAAHPAPAPTLAHPCASGQMDMLLAITDREHILYGSDYPYVPAPVLLKKKQALDTALTERGEMRRVYVENPAALLSMKP